MEKENRYYDKLERARQRVDKIRGFYKHLGIFVIFNAVLYGIKERLTVFFFGKEALLHPDVMDWIYWNIFIWLIILVIHGFLVFGRAPALLQRWEKRQMEKFIQEEEETKNR